MPWKECNRMDERLRFVARLLDGEKMAVVCQEFGISRKTGYKIFNRYKEFGLDGLTDRSRAPHRHPNKLPFQIETAILRIKREHTVVRIGVAGLFIGNLQRPSWNRSNAQYWQSNRKASKRLFPWSTSTIDAR